MNILILIESLTNKINFLYVVFSLFGIHINFLIVKKLLNSPELMPHFYAIIISMILPFFHLYVFHFGMTPLLDINIGDNIPLYYISFGLSFISLFPYIVARRLYT